MEWAKCGDLFSLLKECRLKKNLFFQNGESCLRFILGSVILGLEDLHRKNIVYFDLKLENVLIFEDGYAKLGDFGLAREVAKGDSIIYRHGTPIYFSPQVAFGLKCTRAVDLWAVGILAF